MDKETKLKTEIAGAGANRYVVNPRFSIQSLADEMDIGKEKIYQQFNSRRSILNYYYESRFILYQKSTREIEGYKEFTLAEKLNHLFLTLLDLFDEHREFVLMTYREFIVLSRTGNRFKELFAEELKTFFANDPGISTAATIFQNRLLYTSLLLQFHGLIAFWAKDTSRNRENSMALADKWSSLIEELFYTKIIDRSADLGKFLWNHSPLYRTLNKKKPEDEYEFR